MENRHNNQKNCTFATEILALSATMMFTMIVPELHYYHLGDGVTAFSTTRQGGYSRGNYGQFNINCYCGDDKEAIQKNREALCQLLAIADDHLLMPHQVHLTKIAQIDDAFFALPADERHQALEGVDALMTNIEGVCIGVSTADCIPVLLYDPVQRAACAIHAGWRGTVKRITEQAVAQMTAVYGTRLLKAFLPTTLPSLPSAPTNRLTASSLPVDWASIQAVSSRPLSYDKNNKSVLFIGYYGKKCVPLHP